MSWIKANKEALSFLAMILFAVIALFMLAKFDKSRVSIYEKSFVEKPRDNAYFHANKAVEEFDKTFSNNFASSKETSELDKAIEIHKF